MGNQLYLNSKLRWLWAKRFLSFRDLKPGPLHWKLCPLVYDRSKHNLFRVINKMLQQVVNEGGEEKKDDDAVLEPMPTVEQPPPPLKKRRTESSNLIKNSFKALLEPLHPSTSFKDIGGNEKVLQEVTQLLIHMRHPEVCVLKLGGDIGNERAKAYIC